MSGSTKLRIAFVHPDLGIGAFKHGSATSELNAASHGILTGGAERLVVDAALGLQKLGHEVAIYTSHHDPNHCFDETRDGTPADLCSVSRRPDPAVNLIGTLKVHYVVPPFPRAYRGKFHIFFSHARQLHLTTHLLRPTSPKYDVYFVDQLSTCVPLLRAFGRTRVVFYCHFPDKLLADGAYVEGKGRPRGGLLKRLYRLPMDWLEELTTRESLRLPGPVKH